MENLDRAIITAASNKFFPVLINLIGSIKVNYPNHPKIFVYDLGLFSIFASELKKIENVEVIKMPHFCNFWRSCFTWKSYIFNNPVARLNFYLDAGCQVLRPLDEIFEKIENYGYFAIESPFAPPHPNLDTMTPLEYKSIFRIDEEFYKRGSIVSGIFGFKKDSTISKSLNDLYMASIAGLCLGYSPNEKHFSRGVNKNFFERNCKQFRHDNTLLSLILRRDFKDLKTDENNHSKYAGGTSPHEHPEQLIWNSRRRFGHLEYSGCKIFHKKNYFVCWINRIIFFTMNIISLMWNKIRVNIINKLV